MRCDMLTDEYWPDEAQTLLVQAALAAGDTARQAWARWSASHDMDRLDDSSFHILPQVYRNLERLQATGPEIGRLRGIYRYAWARNQLARRSLVMFLQQLARRNIPCMLIKGMPMLLETYRDMGGRQMHDIDVLIHDDDLHAIGDILLDMGYRFAYPLPPRSMMPFVHAYETRHPHWTDLDLHGRPLMVDCPREAEQQIWDRSREIEIDGATARVPEATDQLMIILVHSRKRDKHSRCRWMADAAAILRDGEHPVDLGALIDHAQACRVFSPVRDALLYLDQTLEGLVPNHVIDRLNDMATDADDRKRYYQLRHESDDHRSVRDLLATHWWRYTGGCRSRGMTRTLWGLAGYFVHHYRRIWGLANVAQVPYHVLVEIGRYLRGTCRDDIQ